MTDAVAGFDQALPAARTAGRERRHRLPVLDGLRGFAVLYVIFLHFFLTPLDAAGPLKRALYGIIELGFTGVDLFFVLSGFLITGILLTNASSDRYFSAFYARRLLRIFPLYYLLCLVCIVVIPAIPFFARYDYFWEGAPASPVYYWLFLNNFDLFLPIRHNLMLGVCWSLAIEEQFYLAWPLVIRLLGKHRALHASVALFVLSALLRNLLHYGYGVDALPLYHATFTHLEAITLGSIIAILRTDPERYRRPLRLLAAQWKLTLPALVACALYGGLFPDFAAADPHLYLHPVMVTAGYTLSALVYGGLLLHCLDGESVLTRTLDTAPMRRCGKYSYAMYLLHVPAWFLTMKLGFLAARLTGLDGLQSPVLVFAVGLPLTYLLAALSWRWLESRANALKDRFPYARSATA